MQSTSFEEILEQLKQSDYEVKHGKYVAVKPKYSDKFIRLKSLGEEYSEQSIRNRLVNKSRFEGEVESNIQKSKPDSLELMLHKTVGQYTIAFAHGFLPVRKHKKGKSLTNATYRHRLSRGKRRGGLHRCPDYAAIIVLPQKAKRKQILVLRA